MLILDLCKHKKPVFGCPGCLYRRDHKLGVCKDCLGDCQHRIARCSSCSEAKEKAHREWQNKRCDDMRAAVDQFGGICKAARALKLGRKTVAKWYHWKERQGAAGV